VFVVITSSIDLTLIPPTFLHCISKSCDFCNVLFDNLDFQILMFSQVQTNFLKTIPMSLFNLHLSLRQKIVRSLWQTCYNHVGSLTCMTHLKPNIRFHMEIKMYKLCSK
jgi:hypothetical protein